MTTVLLRIKNGIAKGREPIAVGSGNSLMASKQHWQIRNIQTKRARLPIYCVLWLIVLGILSVAVFETANKVQITKRKEELAGMCNGRAKTLQDQFEHHVNNTNTFAIFLTQLHRLDRLLDKEQSEEFLRNYLLATVHIHPFLEAVTIEGSIIRNVYNSVMATQSMDVDSSALCLNPGKVNV
ncbi:hypothetical protein CDL15_Pgr025403 [Punica granatum]|uniref:Uncharacterized protein n=1 Tax=Punica granatum TaxID=22663 RepID=A0A218W984_PUNGR|nr:hypothetical protein CDL15_Pgr025403 [Punica granatum]